MELLPSFSGEIPGVKPYCCCCLWKHIIYLGDESGDVVGYDVSSLQLLFRRSAAHSKAILSLSIISHESGHYLLSHGRDGRLCCFSVDSSTGSLELVATFPMEQINFCQFKAFGEKFLLCPNVRELHHIDLVVLSILNNSSEDDHLSRFCISQGFGDLLKGSGAVMCIKIMHETPKGAIVATGHEGGICHVWKFALGQRIEIIADCVQSLDPDAVSFELLVSLSSGSKQPLLALECVSDLLLVAGVGKTLKLFKALPAALPGISLDDDASAPLKHALLTEEDAIKFSNGGLCCLCPSVDNHLIAVGTWDGFVHFLCLSPQVSMASVIAFSKWHLPVPIIGILFVPGLSNTPLPCTSFVTISKNGSFSMFDTATLLPFVQNH